MVLIALFGCSNAAFLKQLGKEAPKKLVQHSSSDDNFWENMGQISCNLNMPPPPPPTCNTTTPSCPLPTPPQNITTPAPAVLGALATSNAASETVETTCFKDTECKERTRFAAYGNATIGNCNSGCLIHKKKVVLDGIFDYVTDSTE